MGSINYFIIYFHYKKCSNTRNALNTEHTTGYKHCMSKSMFQLPFALTRQLLLVRQIRPNRFNATKTKCFNYNDFLSNVRPHSYENFCSILETLHLYLVFCQLIDIFFFSPFYVMICIFECITSSALNEVKCQRLAIWFFFLSFWCACNKSY